MQATENRTTDDRVTDIEFQDAIDGGDVLDVVIVEPVSGVDLQTQLQTLRDGVRDARQIVLPRDRIGGLRVVAGMDLDNRRTDLSRCFELARIGIDEQ